jgi:hypothetical protein
MRLLHWGLEADAAPGVPRITAVAPRNAATTRRTRKARLGDVDLPNAGCVLLESKGRSQHKLHAEPGVPPRTRAKPPRRSSCRSCWHLDLPCAGQWSPSTQDLSNRAACAGARGPRRVKSGAGFPDPRTEELTRTELGAARLALDGERRAEASVARRAARPDLPTAGRAGRSQLGLPLLEVPLRISAADADCDPVAERLAPLLLQPVACGAHQDDSSPQPRSLEFAPDGDPRGRARQFAA